MVIRAFTGQCCHLLNCVLPLKRLPILSLYALKISCKETRWDAARRDPVGQADKTDRDKDSPIKSLVKGLLMGLYSWGLSFSFGQS